MSKQSFSERAVNWIRGGNGSDQLGLTFLFVGLILSFVNIFVRSWIISAVTLVVFAYVVFRTLSHNLEARRRENAAFVKATHPVWDRVNAAAYRGAAQAQDRRTHKYLKCPDCKQRMRVPRGKGKIRVKCPKCGKRFDIKS